MGYVLFRSFFWTFPQVFTIVWNMLPSQHAIFISLMRTLLLKQFNIESLNAALVGAIKKTFRKWSFIYIRIIANLPVVNKIIF